VDLGGAHRDYPKGTSLGGGVAVEAVARAPHSLRWGQATPRRAGHHGGETPCKGTARRFSMPRAERDAGASLCTLSWLPWPEGGTGSAVAAEAACGCGCQWEAREGNG